MIELDWGGLTSCPPPHTHTNTHTHKHTYTKEFQVLKLLRVSTRRMGSEKREVFFLPQAKVVFVTSDGLID